MSVNMPNVPQSPDLFTTNPAFETSGLTSSELMDMAIQRQPDIRTMNHYLGSITEVIPRGDVLSEIADAIMVMSKVIGEIEALLDITYLDSSLSPDLEEAHNQVWSEVVNVAKTEVSDVITISQKAAPNYISYQEYLYAVEHQCRGCRALVMEYDAYVGKTALSFYYDIKTFVSYMHYEMLRMNNVMLYTIGNTTMIQRKRLQKNSTNGQKRVKNIRNSLPVKSSQAHLNSPNPRWIMSLKSKQPNLKHFFRSE